MAFSLVIAVLLSVALLFAHIFAQGFLATRELGVQWNVGPRDGSGRPQSVLAGRAGRASANYQETWPAFLALAFVSGIYGGDPVLAGTGAWCWLLARLVYFPLYLCGVAYWRSAAWLAAFLGLVMMAVAVFL